MATHQPYITQRNGPQNQNFGNPYDCPEGMYGGSMMSSAGYSKVADYSGLPAPPPGGHAFNPNGALPVNAPIGVTASEQPPPPPPGHSGPASLQQSFPGDTGTVIYKPDGVNPAPFIEPPSGLLEM